MKTLLVDLEQIILGIEQIGYGLEEEIGNYLEKELNLLAETGSLNYTITEVLREKIASGDEETTRLELNSMVC